MNNFDPDFNADNDWDEQGELLWTEYDWERYLREQDDVVSRYLAFYETLRDNPARMNEVAHLMGWDEKTGDDAIPPAPVTAETVNIEPYTIYRNPIFIATKAILLGLKRNWEHMAEKPASVPQPLAIRFLVSLNRSEETATLGIHALDLGDYALAISLLKRALQELNRAIALLDDKSAASFSAVADFRNDALPRFFDLREVWLRVMNECRDEIEDIRNDEDDED